MPQLLKYIRFEEDHFIILKQ